MYGIRQRLRNLTCTLHPDFCMPASFRMIRSMCNACLTAGTQRIKRETARAVSGCCRILFCLTSLRNCLTRIGGTHRKTDPVDESHYPCLTALLRCLTACQTSFQSAAIDLRQAGNVKGESGPKNTAVLRSNCSISWFDTCQSAV